jgi:hypothetical protein
MYYTSISPLRLAKIAWQLALFTSQYMLQRTCAVTCAIKLARREPFHAELTSAAVRAAHGEDGKCIPHRRLI